MSGTDDVSGWLPVVAQDQLQEEKAKAGAQVAEALIALEPRARVLALLERAVAGSAQEGALLTAGGLRQVIESFPGEAPVEEAELAAKFPGMVEPSA
jgi:hypothetical protein